MSSFLSPGSPLGGLPLLRVATTAMVGCICARISPGRVTTPMLTGGKVAVLFPSLRVEPSRGDPLELRFPFSAEVPTALPDMVTTLVSLRGLCGPGSVGVLVALPSSDLLTVLRKDLFGPACTCVPAILPRRAPFQDGGGELLVLSLLCADFGVADPGTSLTAETIWGGWLLGLNLHPPALSYSVDVSCPCWLERPTHGGQPVGACLYLPAG